MQIKYQSLYKVLHRPSDGYTQQVEMRNNLPFLVFHSTGFYTEAQLLTMHRNLGHPSVEKQMKVIENTNFKNIPEGVRKTQGDSRGLQGMSIPWNQTATVFISC